MRRDKPRYLRERTRPGFVLIAAALVGVVSILAGCAKETRPPRKRLPPTTERREPKDAIRPYEQAPQAPVTPASQASERLVAKGKALLEAGNLEKAQSTFRDAVNVDSQNGAAYYWLAITQARFGDTDAAMGLLDKADALLSRDPEWSEKIDQARKDFGVGPSNHVVPSPIDEAF